MGVSFGHVSAAKRLRRMGRDRPDLAEQVIQREIFRHLAIRGARGCFVFHVPNGGYRTPTEGAILKGQGVRAGVPDIFAIMGGRTFAIEVKANGGRLSSAQAEALECLRAAGADAAVTYGLDSALRWLEQRGLLRGRTV
jgi:hypothetical protein